MNSGRAALSKATY